MTKTDKLKELVLFVVMSDELQCCISDTHKYSKHGVACPKNFSYSVKGLLIVYDKYVVENYDIAKNMQLDGYKYNNKLIGGVAVLSKKLGAKIFYGNNANDIINACEESYNDILINKLNKDLSQTR